MLTEKNVHICNDNVSSNVIFKEIGPLEVVRGQTITIEEGYFTLCYIDGINYDDFGNGTYEIDDSKVGEKMILNVFNKKQQICPFGQKLICGDEEISLAGSLVFEVKDFYKFANSELGKKKEVWTVVPFSVKDTYMKNGISFIELRSFIQNYLRSDYVTKALNPNNLIQSLRIVLTEKLSIYGIELLDIYKN